MAAFDFSGAAGGLQQSLDEMVKQKFLAQIENRRAMEAQQQLGQGQQRIGLEGRRLGQDASQFDATLGQNRDKLTEDRRQFDATSAQSDARLGMEKELQPVRIKQMAAQTEDLNRQPQEALDARAFQTARDKTQHGYQLGEIGASGANALAVANVRHPEAASPAASQQQNEVTDSIALIDQIMNDPALSSAVGPIDQYIGQAHDLTGVNRFSALHNQIVGKMSLAQAGKLKGQGQISDKERAMLASAATALNRGLSEGDYKAELGKIRSQFERMQQQGGGGTPVQTSPGAAIPGGPKHGDMKTFPNGRKAVFDGQGWVAQ
jgi:hypothetical protein